MRRASARVSPFLAAVALLCISACGQDGPRTATVPAVPEGEKAIPASHPLGEPPPVVEESTEVPRRATPEEVLRSILSGRERVDLAFLARCESVTAEKVRIDKMDEARAWRNYCMRSVRPLWSKIEAALEADRARFAIRGERATATLDVGGAVGEMDLHFVRIAGEWYLQNGEQE